MTANNFEIGWEGKVKHLGENVKIVVWALIVILSGAFFALGAIMNDYLAQKQATYQSLVDKVNILVEQNKTKEQSAADKEITELKYRIRVLEQGSEKTTQ